MAADFACPASLEDKNGGEKKSLVRGILFHRDGQKEFELPPDDGRSVLGGWSYYQWDLRGYKQLALMLRCDYGSAGKTEKPVPTKLKSCEQKLEGYDAKKGTARLAAFTCR